MSALLFSVLLSFSAQADDGYYRLWWNESKTGIFELIKTERGLEGVTRWGKDKGVLDTKNPDPELRNRPVEGITFLSGFDYNAKKNRWVDGSVYDPESGKTYSAKLELIEGGKRLKMRGYIGVSLFGRTAKFDPVLPDEIPADLKW